jgi:hypothetical protein
MDEILIEEKKYISSKRAAKVTGYAKDYIGQLCREGRVPARLVGRNWYVLETAIQDHRFGQQEIGHVNVVETAPSAPEPLSTWESPRYEASPVEALPPIHTPADEQDERTQHLQDSWKEWFDRVADTTPVISDIIPEKPIEKEEEKEVNIPIRTIHHSHHQPLPEDLLPQKTPHNWTEIKPVNEPREETPAQMQRGVGRKSVVAIQILGGLFAVVIAALAVIGSGYFDKYILSVRQVEIITGVVIYNR